MFFLQLVCFKEEWGFPLLLAEAVVRCYPLIGECCLKYVWKDSRVIEVKYGWRSVRFKTFRSSSYIGEKIEAPRKSLFFFF